MPRFAIGNLWDHEHDLTCITTNTVITPAGLVMGAGVAKTAADRHPNLRKAAAQAIRASRNHRQYGFIPLNGEHKHLALFQTKDNYRNPANLQLIRHSINTLRAYAYANPRARIALPYPGIGLGRLTPRTVQPLLKQLPANVIVWRYRS